MMKITAQTEDKLILKSIITVPSKLVLGFFATLPLAGGMAIIVFVGQLNILKCDRTEPKQISCQLTRQSLRGEKTITINQLYKAKLGEREDDDGDTTYRVELETPGGIIPLSPVYTSGRQEKIKRMENTNNFIKDISQDSLIIRQDDRTFAYPFGGMFVLIGLILFLFLLSVETFYIFDRKQNLVTLQRKNIFQNHKKEYPLNQIQQVIIKQEEDSEGYSIVKPKIIFNQNLEIDLKLTGDESKDEEIIKTINNFLQLN